AVGLDLRQRQRSQRTGDLGRRWGRHGGHGSGAHVASQSLSYSASRTLEAQRKPTACTLAVASWWKRAAGLIQRANSPLKPPPRMALRSPAAGPLGLTWASS